MKLMMTNLAGHYRSPVKSHSDESPARTKRDRWFYLLLTITISFTAYWGFTYTYFSPVITGTYPKVPPAIHIHGWSFFLWYLLVPLQALLIAKGRWRLHMTLGRASLLLAAVMVFTRLLVASVRIEHGLSATDVNEFTTFWAYFGQLIMYNLIVFILFYGGAIAWRKHADVHKRMIVLASASALPAAIFRILVALGDYYWLDTPDWVMPAAFLLPSVFILIAMVYDRITNGSIHRVYFVGLVILLAVHGFGLITAGTALGEAISGVMALFAQVFGGLY